MNICILSRENLKMCMWYFPTSGHKVLPRKQGYGGSALSDLSVVYSSD